MAAGVNKNMLENQKAFLDMIAFSELGQKLLENSDNGYDVVVGGSRFYNGYKDHPRLFISLPKLGIKSSAAGRYQILARIYDYYAKLLKLTDFLPESQDKIALQIIKERGAISYINGGDIAKAIDLCKNIWASFPGAGYGQNEHKIEHLLEHYKNSGGTLII